MRRGILEMIMEDDYIDIKDMLLYDYGFQPSSYKEGRFSKDLGKQSFVTLQIFKTLNFALNIFHMEDNLMKLRLIDLKGKEEIITEHVGNKLGKPKVKIIVNETPQVILRKHLDELLMQ